MVLYGATTGRDGIGGVSVLASATLEDSGRGLPAIGADRRPVRREAPDRGLARADRGGSAGGAAGSRRRGHHVRGERVGRARRAWGRRLDLDAVPLREPGMEPFEILTSESQERMLAIVHPSKLDAVRGRLRAVGPAHRRDRRAHRGRDAHRHRTAARSSPRCRRARSPTTGPSTTGRSEPTPAPADGDDPTFAPFEGDLRDAFLSVLTSPNVAEQAVGLGAVRLAGAGPDVAGSGSDAAVIRVPGTMKGLALSSDGKGRFGSLDPYLGAMHAVAEAARNVAVSGAKPLAITNCMNFGNPERPEVMWQFAESIRGMRDACTALGDPGHRRERQLLQRDRRLGDLADAGDRHARPARRSPAARSRRAFPRAGLAVYLLGRDVRRAGRLGVRRGRCWASVAGRPPALDLERERALHDLLFEAARERRARERARLRRRWPGGRARRGRDRRRARVRGDRRNRDLPAARRAVQRVGVARRRERGAARARTRSASSPPRTACRSTRLGETGGPRAVFDGLVRADGAGARRRVRDRDPAAAGRAGLSPWPALARRSRRDVRLLGHARWPMDGASSTMRDRQIDGFAEALAGATATPTSGDGLVEAFADELGAFRANAGRPTPASTRPRTRPTSSASGSRCRSTPAAPRGPDRRVPRGGRARRPGAGPGHRASACGTLQERRASARASSATWG